MSFNEVNLLLREIVQRINQPVYFRFLFADVGGRVGGTQCGYGMESGCHGSSRFSSINDKFVFFGLKMPP